MVGSVADGSVNKPHRGKYIGTAKVGPPWGKTFHHDEDGRVPEYLSKHIAGSSIGRAQGRWTSSSGMHWHIRYDRDWWKNNPQCRDKARRHERGHARGFGHGEGSPSRNPSYYATFTC
jgi:hypothetical protein